MREALPLANVPKVKKPRQPLRRKKDLSHGGPHPFVNALARNKPMKKKGPRGIAQTKNKQAALDQYFKNFGYIGYGGWVVKCQITGMEVRRDEVHPCHKIRSSQSERKKGIGGEGPENIVCGHWKAHRWLDSKGSKSDREKILRASPANCKDGGVIDWPAEEKASLEKAMGQPIPGPDQKEP